MNYGFWNFYKVYNQNRMLTRNVTPLGDDLSYPMRHLSETLISMGHQTATLDMQPLEWFDRVFFLDYPTRVNRYYRGLLEKKHADINLIICEPPIVRPDNYNKQNHQPFRKVMTWKRDLAASDPAKYLLYHLPNKFQERTAARPFAERKLCCLINSFMFSIHPRELYTERIRAIRWFEANAPSSFDLIGVEWDKPLFTGQLSRLNFPLRFFYRRIGLLKKLKIRRFPSFIGPNVKTKHLTLKDYRFCIAYENSCEPDYLSEKLFDCFFAGCVPIYDGAPNVLDTIPASTFIDKRKYSYDELYRCISAMTEQEYNGYLEAIESFLRSPAMRPFTAEAYTEFFVKNFARERG